MGRYTEPKDKVFIVQLTGFNRDVQLMITEFILWDIWNYQLHHGDKNKPFPVILDEAQNLDRREKSPSAKILTEGRKFGWSGWYATQSLKGQFTTDEISRLQNSSQKCISCHQKMRLVPLHQTLLKIQLCEKNGKNDLQH